jgi:hypothetical protein
MFVELAPDFRMPLGQCIADIVVLSKRKVTV